MNLYGFDSSPFTLALLFVWSMFWKGVSLWRAGKQNQKNWFIALLLINTAGILEIVYLFKFSEKKLTINELKDWLKLK